MDLETLPLEVVQLMLQEVSLVLGTTLIGMRSILLYLPNLENGMTWEHVHTTKGSSAVEIHKLQEL